MARHERGLYEVLITEALDAELRELGDRLEPRRTHLRAAEAADRVALHLSRVLQRAVAAAPDDERVAVGIALARRLIDEIHASIAAADVEPERPIAPGAVLRAVAARRPDGRPESIPEPLIPLLDTTLLTNAPGEPRVGHQVVTEIRSADRIDLVMAFIRRSGIAPMLDALRAHCAAGRGLRVLTTTYTGSTEPRALDALRDVGAEVRVSHDTSTTRLHLIHWESQSVVREGSDTGLRYQRHVALGTGVMLFARLRSDERAFVFLGPATYVKHESELPMAVTWRLRHRLPGDLFASFAAAVA